MLQIQNVVVSFDLLKEKFLCDLGACHGACCIEGDAGAPLELDEVAQIEDVLPHIWGHARTTGTRSHRTTRRGL